MLIVIVNILGNTHSLCYTAFNQKRKRKFTFCILKIYLNIIDLEHDNDIFHKFYVFFFIYLIVLTEQITVLYQGLHYLYYAQQLK